MKAIIIKLKHYIKMAAPLVVVVAVLGCLAGWAWHQYTPHPLGSQMEYLGKEDYGNIFGFDSAPYSEYYYGTDIAPQEISQYFKGTKLEHPIEDKVQYTDVWLTYKGKTVSVTYVQEAPMSIKKTGKKYVVDVLDEDYKTLQDILNSR